MNRNNSALPATRSSTQTVSLIVRRTIRATPERLFSAWTEPEQLRAWWGPENVRCSGAAVDLRVGGKYRIDNQLPDGKVISIFGEFEEIAAPRKLVYTWWVDSGMTPEEGAPVIRGPERVTVRFEPKEGATEVIVVHERIADTKTRDSHEQGWEGCLNGLSRWVDDSSATPPMT